MAVFFDDKNEVKCELCGSTTFEEVPIYAYKHIENKDKKILKRTLCYVKLRCFTCNHIQDNLNDLNKYTIIE